MENCVAPGLDEFDVVVLSLVRVHWMMDAATQLLQEMYNLGLVYCYLTTIDFLWYCLNHWMKLNSSSW